MQCSVDGCNKLVEKCGLCGMHYRRKQRHGDVNIVLHKVTLHGYSKHPLYKVRNNIISRCYNKNHPSYKWYGGSGILMFKEWRDNVEVFIEWALANGWKEGLTIERKNNNDGYYPYNCEFKPIAENLKNQRLLKSTNTSGYRGVYKEGKKWRARIIINGERKNLGVFDSLKLATLAYDVEAYLANDGRPMNFIDRI
jgi:hypothetical protein